MLSHFVRAMRLRCPHCGGGPIFTRWSRLLPVCPVCGLGLERGEEGYWLGAMAINLGVTEAVFGILVIAWAALTWPDVPWMWVLVVGLVVNAALPIVFYPFSKTLFLAVDLILIHADDRSWRANQRAEPSSR